MVFKLGSSNIDSPDWIKKKNAVTNRKNKDDKCFQYAGTFALDYGEIKCNPERVSNMKPFINKYSWDEINHPSKKGDWKALEKNNPTIVLNIFYTKEMVMSSLHINQLAKIKWSL